MEAQEKEIEAVSPSSITVKSPTIGRALVRSQFTSLLLAMVAIRNGAPSGVGCYHGRNE